MLEAFRTAKGDEVAALIACADKGCLPAAFSGTRLPFAASLRQKACPVIAEYKRASPSQGDINLSAAPHEVAAAYAAAGAGAISVLTEERYFKGSLAFLESMGHCGLPLLRKDFIIHPLQVDQTAATPASAMLVIVRMLDDAALAEIVRRCLLFGLEPVCEIFDACDLDRARVHHAPIIQVNNRNLETLSVDPGNARRLIGRKEHGEFWICASGITSGGELAACLTAGYDAALVGTALMRGNDQGAELAALVRGAATPREEAQ